MDKIEKIKEVLGDWDRELSVAEQDLPPGKRKTAEARRELFYRLSFLFDPDQDSDIDILR